MGRGETTRRKIIDTATRLFAERGFEQVSTTDVQDACAISRGALYHHFASKEALFTVVLETVEAEIAAQLLTSASGIDEPLDSLRAGCRTWLELARTDATVRQIVLMDAPAVIGWQAWRALDDKYSLGLLRTGLSAAASRGQTRQDHVDLHAHMLLAVLVEIALMIVRSPENNEIVDSGREAIEQMIAGFATANPSSLSGI